MRRGREPTQQRKVMEAGIKVVFSRVYKPSYGVIENRSNKIFSISDIYFLIGTGAGRNRDMNVVSNCRAGRRVFLALTAGPAQAGFMPNITKL
jgi:hypothetical protein